MDKTLRQNAEFSPAVSVIFVYLFFLISYFLGNFMEGADISRYLSSFSNHMSYGWLLFLFLFSLVFAVLLKTIEVPKALTFLFLIISVGFFLFQFTSNIPYLFSTSADPSGANSDIFTTSSGSSSVPGSELFSSLSIYLKGLSVLVSSDGLFSALRPGIVITFFGLFKLIMNVGAFFSTGYIAVSCIDLLWPGKFRSLFTQKKSLQRVPSEALSSDKPPENILEDVLPNTIIPSTANNDLPAQNNASAVLLGGQKAESQKSAHRADLYEDSHFVLPGEKSLIPESKEPDSFLDDAGFSSPLDKERN